MSDPASSRARLAPWARSPERKDARRGRLEVAVLALVGLVLLVATINDLVLQAHTNHRLVRDLATWRAATGLHWKDLGIERDVARFTSTDTICGNVAGGPPDESTQLCLTMVGRVIGGHRYVTGGYYLPPVVLDEPANRYSCFGQAARERICAMMRPPQGAPPSPPIRLGRP
jgi:hypothetical protein